MTSMDIKKQVKLVVRIANTKNAKKFKKVIFFVFAALVVLDIVFVASPKFPSISRVIYNSSPKFIVLIWLFGLFISNVFLQRKVQSNTNFIWNFIVLLAVSCGILILGNTIKLNGEIDCANYQTEIPKAEIKYVTRVLCQEEVADSIDYINRDCQKMNCNGAVYFKLDVTNEIKLLLLILGILAGYLFWPKVIEN